MALKNHRQEILLVVAFYAFMATIYYIALVLDTGLYNLFRGSSINHLLKALISLPIWWLIFNYLKDYSLWKRLLVHLVMLPLFTITSLWLYYTICDYIGIRRAQGGQIVWDFYITVLFYIVQFGCFHLYDYYKKLQQQQLVATQLSKLKLESELTALKAQLNPHFLYNVFNTINAAIPSTAKNARDMIHKLSDLFRYQLKASKTELVALKEELVFVKKYLELEKERFGDRLQFEIEVPRELWACQIPPLLIQPIVENAVKHGIEPLIEGGKISLVIRKVNQILTILISDTGRGIDKPKSDLLKRGIGLSNTDKRLQKMYGQGLVLTDNKPSGLSVQLNIPLSNGKTIT